MEEYSKSAPKKAISTNTSKQWVHSGALVSTVSQGDTDSWDDTADGVKNPYWREQVKAGHQAGTNFVGFRRMHSKAYFALGEEYRTNPPYVPTGGWLKYAESVGRYQIPDQLLSDISDLQSVSQTKADNEALRNYVSKVRGKQTTFQGGTFIGELHQVVRAIKNPVKSLRRGFSSYTNQLKKTGKKIKSLSKVRKRKILADTWLEYSFGWRPLLNDIDHAANALADSMTKYWEPEWEVVRGVGKSKETDRSLFGNAAVGNPFYSFTIRKDTEVIIRYMGAVDVGNYALSNSRRVGLDYSNWLPTAWEILPWSFLIDYFTNIGDIVSAASLARSSLRWTLKTVRVEERLFTERWIDNIPSRDNRFQTGFATFNSPGTASVKSTYVGREPYTGSLVPTLEFSLPWSGRQWLNLAALSIDAKQLRKYYT